MARRRNILLARRAERLARETTAPTQQRYAQPRLPNHAHASGSNVTERRPTIDDPAARDGGPSPPSRGAPRSRGETNMRGGTRGGRGGTRGGRGRGRGRGRGGDSERPERSNEDGEGVPEIDDWLTSDEIHVASYTEPEIGMGDLNLLPHDTPAPLKFLSAQARRESLGGDYSRFIPTNPQLFISAAKKLGPTKHSSVVMAHNEHLPITDRTHVQELVGSVGRQG
ncbi:hypothetical protein FB451DRAFT_527808 [Mycena latifolia]|nr:hypothetical protein FB451DRAFT_527808 [Mycena latifolia]